MISMSPDIAPRPTPRHQRVVDAAARMALEQGHDYVGVEHLFLAILSDPEAIPTRVMAELIDPDTVSARVRDLIDRY
jgi:ATP-dependent Clp protease ATP-binding subunit ClpA